MVDGIISYYQKISDTHSKQTVPLDRFFADIRNGRWQDLVTPVRLAKDPEEKKKLKNRLPSVTLSGYFKDTREDAKLTNHSGLIAIDFDKLGDQLNYLLEQLNADRYTYASFMSCSGSGACVVIRVDGKKHRDAFNGYKKYIYDNYPDFEPYLDSSCINESRARFVTFDPNMFLNEDAEVFKKYAPKEKPAISPKIIYVQTEFDRIMFEIDRRNLQIIPDDSDGYINLQRCAFVLAEKFGEHGRSYWHILCRNNKNYNSKTADRRYNSALKSKGTGVTIATLYYYFKRANLQLYSPETTKIINLTNQLRRNGVTKDGIIENLEKRHGIPAETSAQIVEDVVTTRFETDDNNESIGNQIRDYLTSNYNLQLNAITLEIEDNYKRMNNADLNTLFENVQNAVGQAASTNKIKQILGSNYVQRYDPFHKFFDDNVYNIPNDPLRYIHDFCQCIETDNMAYFIKYTTKWLVSIIEAMCGGYSPLMHILCGPLHGGGKTQFYRRLLPTELQDYWATTKMDQGKDDRILICKKLLIILDDIDEKFFSSVAGNKNMLDTEKIDVRPPFGALNETMYRLSVLCGTTNMFSILQDLSNRRYLPFLIRGINIEKYNRVDKTQLLMSAYQLHKSGFNWRVLGQDIHELEDFTKQFKNTSDGVNLLNKYFRVPPLGTGEAMTITDIRHYISTRTNIKFTLTREEIESCGFRYMSNITANKSAGYYVERAADGMTEQSASPISFYNPAQWAKPSGNNQQGNWNNQQQTTGDLPF